MSALRASQEGGYAVAGTHRHVQTLSSQHQ
jgi:hypothetical protein